MDVCLKWNDLACFKSDFIFTVAKQKANPAKSEAGMCQTVVSGVWYHRADKTIEPDKLLDNLKL